MSNDNLRNALTRVGASYEPGADLTVNIMKRVKLRARRQRIIFITMIAFCTLTIAGLFYFIAPVFAPVFTISNEISFTRLLPLCGVCTLLCLLLVADILLRKKFMPTGQAIEKAKQS